MSSHAHTGNMNLTFRAADSEKGSCAHAQQR
jgi:hypothetical protein